MFSLDNDYTIIKCANILSSYLQKVYLHTCPIIMYDVKIIIPIGMNINSIPWTWCVDTIYQRCQKLWFSSTKLGNIFFLISAPDQVTSASLIMYSFGYINTLYRNWFKRNASKLCIFFSLKPWQNKGKIKVIKSKVWAKIRP